jgi:lipid-A-disaccharide synthase
LKNPVIFISAGEASGEHYGALLAAALQQELAAKDERAELIGMGGPRMAAAGVECIVPAEDMAVMGFTEVVLHLPRIYREFQKLKRAIRVRRPSIAILIDFPEIHFRLAKFFRELGVPVIYFVSPQLWAWKQHRIRLVRKYVRRMLVIFPFEEPFYRERGVAAEFVGHPLAELPPPTITREQFAVENHLNPSRTWIALLPGSRVTEIRDHLPTMLAAAGDLAQVAPPANSAAGYEFLIPLAPTLNTAQKAAVKRMVEHHGTGLTVRLIVDSGAEGDVSPTEDRGPHATKLVARDAGGARAALLHARASVVASGTATVEAALMGNPFVVVYHVSPVTYAIAKRVVKVPHVAMVNLIAGKRVVPELIQSDFTAAIIVQQLMQLLPDGAARESIKVELGAIQSALRAPTADQSVARPGAIARVAEVVLEELEAGSPAAVAAAQH